MGITKRRNADQTENRPIKDITLHVLLIAIDEYNRDDFQLKGCVNDLKAINAYLQNYAKGEGLKSRTRILQNEQATRQGIIDGFQHFKAAKDGDICLLYYSGHGSYSAAAREFWIDDPDQKHEGLVCHDSRSPDSQGDLLDKELSYLIWDACLNKDLHFVSIMDCCHSGSNTKVINDQVRSRRVEPDLTSKELSQYLGHKFYKEELVSGERYLRAPKAKHISLSAAKNTETAKELLIGEQQRGVFTYSLIQALKDAGNRISYSELINQTNVRVRSQIGEQSPQIDVVEADKNGLFLDGALMPIPDYFLIGYDVNRIDDPWVLYAGAIQQIPENAELTLEDGSKVVVIEVLDNYSVVSGMEGRDLSQKYKASLPAAARFSLSLSFADQSEAGQSVRKTFKEVLAENPKMKLQFVDEPSKARYLIHTDQNQLVLSRPNEKKSVFQPIEGLENENIQQFLGNCHKLAQWISVMELTNRNSLIDEEEVKIELWKIQLTHLEDEESWEEILIEDPYTLSDAKDYHHKYINGDWSPPHSQSNVFHFDYVDGEWYDPVIRLKITNNSSNNTYYISTLYLDYALSITNKHLDKVELKPGEFAYLKLAEEDEDINFYFHIAEEHYEQGLTEATDYVKVLISTTEINTDVYNQEGLGEGEFNVKGLTKQMDGPVNDWTVRTIPLTMVWPQHKGSIEPEKSIPLGNMTLQMGAEQGAAFSAQVSLVSPQEQSRSVGKPTPDMLPNNRTLQAYDIVPGVNETPGLSVLELFGTQGKENISSQNPILLRPNETLPENEAIIPFGYDPQTGLYYPLGFTDEEGIVSIEQLPDETPTGVRSLKGSIKIFFQKIVKPAGAKLEYPLLRQVVNMTEADPLEEVNYITDPEEIADKLKDVQNIALFIHGIIGDTGDSPKSLLRAKKADGRSLIELYDMVLVFDYENLTTPIQETARMLGERLGAIGLVPGHDKNLHVFAHSMGGAGFPLFY